MRHKERTNKESRIKKRNAGQLASSLTNRVLRTRFPGTPQSQRSAVPTNCPANYFPIPILKNNLPDIWQVFISISFLKLFRIRRISSDSPQNAFVQNPNLRLRTKSTLF